MSDNYIIPALIKPAEIIENDEIFLPITCYDIELGRYEVSSFGRIKDLLTNNISTGYMINSGYLTYRFRLNNGYLVTYLIHRVVAETFKPHHSKDRTQVNHDFGVKYINHYLGLSWMTPKENMAHAIETGLFTNYNENCHLSVLTNEQVHQICKYLSTGNMSYGDILISMGMDISNSNNFDLIGNIYRKIAWNNISSQYEIPVYDRSLFRSYTDEIEVRNICKFISEGKSIPEIYELITGCKFINSRTDKYMYERIRMIKTHKIFNSISVDYNF